MTTTKSYDLIGEVGTSGLLVRSYVWGNDLSGSQQGAGGVAGLLEVSYYGTQTTNCFAAYDGNGNLSVLVSAADGTMAARYEYGPFGEVIRITSPMAKANPFRFSTKYQDDETDLLYYGYRYYSASTGRWLSRDPASEKAFVQSLTANEIKAILTKQSVDINLYSFINNQPIKDYDLMGLCPKNQCDYWKLTLITVVGAGSGPAAVAATAEVKAFKFCCMDNYANNYQYVGVGVGGGLDFGISINTTEGNWFDTPCIPWEAHNGFGRLSAWGIGVGKTFGAVWARTPKTYQYFAGTSYGLDLAAVTTLGYWHITPGESQPIPGGD